MSQGKVGRRRTARPSLALSSSARTETSLEALQRYGVDSLVRALPPDGADPVFADFFSLLNRIRGQLLSHPVHFDTVPCHPAG
jgi:hypothetical protein